MGDLVLYVVSGTAVGLIYGLVALGMVIIYKSSGVFNIAQGSLLMIGAYLCFTFANQIGLPFWVSTFLAAALGLLLGLAIDRLFIRRMIGQPVLSTIMITIGLWVMLVGVGLIFWNPTVLGYAGIETGTIVDLGVIKLQVSHVYAAGASLLVFLIFSVFYWRSGLGIEMRATADDETAAHSMGLSSKAIYSISWAIACVVATLGGICLAMISGVGPALTELGFKAFPVILLGGLESIGGALVGGIIIGILENLAAGYLDPIVGGGMKDVFPFIAMIFILLIRPYGLFGLRRIERI